MPSSNVQKGLKAAAVLSAALPLVNAQVPTVDDSCDCFVTDNGLTFTNNRVWNWAAHAEDAGIGATEKIQDQATNNAAGVSSDYFSSSDFADSWYIETFEPEVSATQPIQRSNSANNVYLQQNADDPTSSYLTLRTYRSDSGDFQASGEFSSLEKFSSLSMRAQARTHGASGACSGLFTYMDTNGYEYESDTEILTYLDDTTINYTRHPEREESDGTTHYAQVPIPGNGSRSDWHVYRTDWYEEGTQWSVDGEEAADMTHDMAQVDSSVILNMWSQGNDQWEKTMAPGDQADFDVYWLQVIYNNTESAGKTCSKTCNV